MFENLSERLERSFKILKGEGSITEINVAETLKDVRRALLDADVNYKVAKNFTDTVKQKALGQNVLTSVKPGQLMVKIVHDELAQLMGGQAGDGSRFFHRVEHAFPSIRSMMSRIRACSSRGSSCRSLRESVNSDSDMASASCHCFTCAWASRCLIS